MISTQNEPNFWRILANVSLTRWRFLTRKSLVGTVACLADGAWLVVHCGPMRSSGKMCDIPFEVKKILEGIDGVSLQDEIVCVPPLASGAMRFTSAFSNKSHLTNQNTRMVVAWKGRDVDIPGGHP